MIFSFTQAPIEHPSKINHAFPSSETVFGNYIRKPSVFGNYFQNFGNLHGPQSTHNIYYIQLNISTDPLVLFSFFPGPESCYIIIIVSLVETC